ncbi:unnamed protein product, partial [Meganyctiphanes norvegica]
VGIMSDTDEEWLWRPYNYSISRKPLQKLHRRSSNNRYVSLVPYYEALRNSIPRIITVTKRQKKSRMILSAALYLHWLHVGRTILKTKQKYFDIEDELRSPDMRHKETQTR